MANIVSGYMGRLVSLDAFRGATIAAMVLVNNPGDSRTTFAPLLHAKWHGWTFTDLVFPFFLWIVGVAMTFSYARRVEAGADKGKLLLHTLRRAALIFLLGLLLNGFPHYDLASLRIPGVLQRIAVCYLIGSVIYLYTSNWKQRLWSAVALCAVYWMLMTLYPVPGYGPGVLEPIGNFAQYIDQMLLPGHLYSQTKVWDPEGFVSTLPAIANVLMGVITGELLRTKYTPTEKTVWILVSGWGLAVLGMFLDNFMPINKQLWTPPYAAFTSGLAALTFGCFYWFTDVLGYRKGTGWLVVYGMNAIVAYTLSGLFARMLSLTGIRQPLYQNVFAAVAPPYLASLLFALMNAGVIYLAVWIMYKRGWFVRL